MGKVLLPLLWGDSEDNQWNAIFHLLKRSCPHASLFLLLELVVDWNNDTFTADWLIHSFQHTTSFASYGFVRVYMCNLHLSSKNGDSEQWVVIRHGALAYHSNGREFCSETHTDGEGGINLFLCEVKFKGMNNFL